MQASAVFSRKADFLLVTIGCTKNFHVSISFLLIYLIDGLDLDAPDFAYPGTYLEEEMVPYLDAALSGETVYSQKIIDTTWGHIFTACYPVIASDGTNDILGALCIVMVQTALESGMNDHVAKPIDMKVLMNVLEEQICGRKGS